MPAKHQHFVSQFYQRRFADSAGLLWVYDRKDRLYRHLPPKAICVSKELYTFFPEAAPADRRIETQFISGIEGKGANSIRQLAREKCLTAAERFELSCFMALQRLRSPEERFGVDDALVAMVTSLAQGFASDKEKLLESLNQFKVHTGNDTISAEVFIDFVENRKIKFKATEIPFLQHILKLLPDLSRYLNSLGWMLLLAPKASQFVFSDTPFLVVPAKGSNASAVGLASQGSTIFFPLGKDMCLKFDQTAPAFDVRTLSSAQVRVVNCNIAINSNRFVMAADKPHLEAIIRRSNTLDLPPIRNQTETLDVGSGQLIVQSILPRRYLY